MAYDERNDGSELPADETAELIASNKVEGTAVYGADREKLGHVKNFMVGKRSGKVEYAVLVFGGLFGMGGENYPLPWNQLTYDEDQGGYVVDLERSRLQGGPHYAVDQDPAFDLAYRQRINDYYETGV